MVLASYVNSAEAQKPPMPGFAPNGNFALDQISLFFAGGLGPHLGAFIQTTYDGVAKAFTWQNLDVRAVTTAQIKGADVVLGASLNNSPTVQDAWNTLPAWGSPYTGPALAPSLSASPLMAGALAQTSLGLTAYAWINSEFYLEAGAYGSPGATILTHLGGDTIAPGSIKGLAPYGRIALQRDVGGGTLEAGVFGMRTSIYPGLDRSPGLTDDYTDLGLDASYIKTLQNGGVFAISARYLREQQSLLATCILALQSDGAVFAPQQVSVRGCESNALTDVRAEASYSWRDKIGVTAAVFNTSGSANPILYLGRTAKPDATGVTLQIDGAPSGAARFFRRFNVRIGLQYALYTQHNGAGFNWVGAYANASDNNALRVFTWIAF